MEDDDKRRLILFGERASLARPVKAWRPSNCLLRLHQPQVEHRVRLPIPSRASTSSLYFRLRFREPRVATHHVPASTNEPSNPFFLILRQREAWQFLRYHLLFPGSAYLSLPARRLDEYSHFDQRYPATAGCVHRLN